MARSVEDLELFCSVAIAGQPWLHDPRCIELPWRKPPVPSKLKVGVMWNDGIVTPSPPVARALKITVNALKNSGHEIIEWEPTSHAEGNQLVVGDISS